MIETYHQFRQFWCRGNTVSSWILRKGSMGSVLAIDEMHFGWDRDGFGICGVVHHILSQDGVIADLCFLTEIADFHRPKRPLQFLDFYGSSHDKKASPAPKRINTSHVQSFQVFPEQCLESQWGYVHLPQRGLFWPSVGTSQTNRLTGPTKPAPFNRISGY